MKRTILGLTPVGIFWISYFLLLGAAVIGVHSVALHFRIPDLTFLVGSDRLFQ